MIDKPELKTEKLDPEEKQEIIKQAEKEARKRYMKGYNCAESVFKTTINILQKRLGLEIDKPQNLTKMATGFGEGIGKYGTTCGAITGGTMALSLLYGFNSPEISTKQERIGEKGRYKLFNQLPHRFEQKFGSTICRELTKDFSETYSKPHLLQCQKITSKTTGMVIEIILREQTEGIKDFEFQKTI